MRLAPSNLDPVSLDQQECSDFKWLPPLFHTEQVYFIGASPNQEGLRSGTAMGHGQASWSLVSWQPYLKHEPGPRDQRLFGFRIQCPTNQAFLHLSLKICGPWGPMDTPHLHRNRHLDKIVLRLLLCPAEFRIIVKLTPSRWKGKQIMLQKRASFPAPLPKAAGIAKRGGHPPNKQRPSCHHFSLTSSVQ